MQQIFPVYYPDFQCTASACSDNCCIGWEIDVDADTYARYTAEKGAFGDRLRAQIAHEDPPHFILGAGERCSFLNQNNLCDIYRTLGEAALCEICTQHPRFHNWFGAVKESGVGLCCEAAAALMLKHEAPLTFLSRAIDETPDPFDEQPLFEALLPVRAQIFELLQTRSRPLGDRLAAVLLAGCAVQDALDGDDPCADLAALTAAVQERPGLFFDLLPEGDPSPAPLGELLAFFRTLEPIGAGWPARLENITKNLDEISAKRPDFLRAFAAYSYEYEQLAVYFVYRYFLTAVFDGDALAKLKLAAVSLLLLSLLGTARWLETGALPFGDRVKLAKDYSKEIEYCEENLERFWSESWENEGFSAEALIAALRGTSI